MTNQLADDFHQYIAQTSRAALGFEPHHGSGIYLYDRAGRKYIDLISGIGVSNLGHGQPAIIEAIQRQAQDYIHSMVYGEHIQTPQVAFAKRLISQLPPPLEQVYFVNSGSEAIEGAVKLAKRVTGRFEIVAVKGGYHGNTQSTMALMDSTYYKEAFRPLMPGIRFIEHDATEDFALIGEHTAAVVLEPIQGAMGYRQIDSNYLMKLQSRCREVGALLIFDEIQTGLGRSGELWGFEHSQVVPDIICLAKSLGGGMPIGAFIASRTHMQALTHHPVLGHITTFGGHAVSCAAGLAAFELLMKNEYWKEANHKEELFRSRLNHPNVKSVSGVGLMLAVNLVDPSLVFRVIDRCLALGVLTDGFLHNNCAIRIAPPLIISTDEIDSVCSLLMEALDTV